EYQVRAQKDGFRPLERTGVVVPVATTLRLDLSLSIGAITETVAVSVPPRMLQETPEVGNSVTSRDYEQLPILQVGRIRTPASFLTLAPGVQGDINENGTENVAATNQLRVNGGPTLTNQAFIDGLPAGIVPGNMNESAPSVDAVGEFRIQTSLPSAEYGYSGSA